MLRSNSLMWLTTEHNDIISLIYHKSIIIMLLSSDSFSQSYNDNIFYCNKVDYGKDFMSAALYFETTVRYDQRIDFEIHSAKDFLKHVLLTKHYWTGVCLSNYICRNTLQQTEKNWEVWVPRAIQEKLAAMFIGTFDKVRTPLIKNLLGNVSVAVKTSWILKKVVKALFDLARSLTAQNICVK